MTIKSRATTKGIPFGRIAVSPGTGALGVSQVTAHISADIPISTVLVTAYLSTAEARDLAARLIVAADKADELALAEAASAKTSARK